MDNNSVKVIGACCITKQFVYLHVKFFGFLFLLTNTDYFCVLIWTDYLLKRRAHVLVLHWLLSLRCVHAQLLG